VSAGPDLTGDGTEAAEWERWAATSRPARLELDLCRRVVVVAPHPDDEVLGTGGLLLQLARRGVRIDVVAVTDGEGSHPHSPTFGPADIVGLRVAELAEAYDVLGLGVGPGEVTRHRLGLPDGAVTAHRHAVTTALRDLLAGWAPSGLWCVAPWEHDGHPDHDAAGLAARQAAAACGVRLVPYLVWAWHWSRPGDPQLPWDRVRVLTLDEPDRRRKRAAVDRFTSQLTPLSEHPGDAPPLGAQMVARATGPVELYLDR
jgi:LmbE family N-acetylglucosaminyl deacetylase